jgi:hypothetical protein
MALYVVGGNSWVKAPFVSVPKRFTHRASSFAYLKQWQMHKVDYASKMATPFYVDQNPGVNMYNSPEKVRQILCVEAAMKMRGLTPFVHAMPASSRVLLEFYKIFSPSHRSQPIRSPFDSHRGLNEIRKNLPKETDRVPRSDLLAVSYALTSNTVPLESAASWGFVNHFGKEQYYPMVDRLSSVLSEWEKRSGRKVPDSFLVRGRSLISHYNRLKVGDFFIFGVPPGKLTSWMYDSGPYFVPTGRDIRAIVDQPQVEETEGTLATLMLGKEVLSPSSALTVVSSDEADRFCHGFNLVEPSKIALYDPILNSAPTAFEKEEKEARKHMEEKLGHLLSDFKTWAETGIEPLDRQVDDAEPMEVPAWLP